MKPFFQFHSDHPEVYHTLVALTRQAVKSGRKHVGIRMVWEAMRWQRYLQTDEVPYKLNNNYHSQYARLIMESEPDLANVFEIRTRRYKDEGLAI